MADDDDDDDQWNPLETKVFDVYVDSAKVSQLKDIFSYEVESEDNETASQSSNGVELVNTGVGKRSQAVDKWKMTETLNRPNVPPAFTDRLLKLEDSFEGGLATPPPPLLKNEDSSMPTHKWPRKIEQAFVDALRIIAKKGTFKINIKDRNYGRNELISLYIRYHTGELRTKKQVSSHIQVWKKTLANKISNKTKLEPCEEELHRLIENGPEQDAEAVKHFFKLFEDMIDELSKSGMRLGTESLSSDETAMITPVSAGLVNGKSFLMEDEFRIPQTPLEHAKVIYKKLESFKCIPSKFLHSYCKRNSLKLGKRSPNNGIWKSIMDIKLRQRQLITKKFGRSRPTPVNRGNPDPLSPRLFNRSHGFVNSPNGMMSSAPPPLFNPPVQSAQYPPQHYIKYYSGEQIPVLMPRTPYGYYQQPQHMYIPVLTSPTATAFHHHHQKYLDNSSSHPAFQYAQNSPNLRSNFARQDASGSNN